MVFVFSGSAVVAAGLSNPPTPKGRGVRVDEGEQLLEKKLLERKIVRRKATRIEEHPGQGPRGGGGPGVPLGPPEGVKF